MPTICTTGCAAGLTSPRLSALLPHHALASAMPDIRLSFHTELFKVASSACLQLGRQA